MNPLLDDKFVATAPLDRRKEDAVSFQFKDKPGWFLRVRERSCFLNQRNMEDVTVGKFLERTFNYKAKKVIHFKLCHQRNKRSNYNLR